MLYAHACRGIRNAEYYGNQEKAPENLYFVRINEELGKTILLVTHDPIVASYCKKIIFLKDGEILETIEREKDRTTFYQKIIGKMAEL